MDNKQISIKFCGGCNPRIDRGRVAANVREIMGKSGFTVFFNKPDVNFVIYISGCSADCARRYSAAVRHHIAVHGEAVDSIAVNEEQLVREIIDRVRDHFERVEKGLSG